MNNENKFSPADERACTRLSPHVRQACNSTPPPAVMAAIHAAAVQRANRGRVLPFIRFAAAAAALLVVTLTGWFLIRSSMPSEAARQAALMDDMLFLCCERDACQPAVPCENREDVAERLLNLQGLDAVTVPIPETPAEPPAPPSKESQSRNTFEPLAQRCG